MGSSHLGFFDHAAVQGGSQNIGGVQSQSSSSRNADWLRNDEDFGDEVAAGFQGGRNWRSSDRVIGSLGLIRDRT